MDNKSASLPLLEVFSIKMSKVSDKGKKGETTTELYGKIGIQDKYGTVLIYDTTKEDALILNFRDTISLLLNGPRRFIYAAEEIMVGLDLKHKYNDEDIFYGPIGTIWQKDLLFGKDGDYHYGSVFTESFRGDYGIEATITLAAVEQAALVNVGFALRPSSSLVAEVKDAVQVCGQITASSITFPSQEIILFSKKKEDRKCVVVQADEKIELSRYLLAVALGSELILRLNLFDGNTGLDIANGVQNFHIKSMHVGRKRRTFIPGLEDVEVSVEWKTSIRDMKKVASRYFRSMGNVGEIEEMVRIPYHTPLMEVFSVEICKEKGGAPSKIYGRVAIRDMYGSVLLYQRAKEDPLIINPGDSIQLLLMGPKRFIFACDHVVLGLYLKDQNHEGQSVLWGRLYDELPGNQVWNKLLIASFPDEKKGTDEGFILLEDEDEEGAIQAFKEGGGEGHISATVKLAAVARAALVRIKFRLKDKHMKQGDMKRGSAAVKLCGQITGSSVLFPDQEIVLFDTEKGGNWVMVQPGNEIQLSRDLLVVDMETYLSLDLDLFDGNTGFSIASGLVKFFITSGRLGGHLQCCLPGKRRIGYDIEAIADWKTDLTQTGDDMVQMLDGYGKSFGGAVPGLWDELC